MASSGNCEGDTDVMEGSDDGWEEDEECIMGPCKCLFCDDIYSTAEETMDHCKHYHQVDMRALCQHCNLDSYAYIQMINYIRKMRPTPGDLLGMFENKASPWKDPQYLIPEDHEDPLLMIEIAPYISPDGVCSQLASGQALETINEDSDEISISRSTLADLQEKFRMSECKCMELCDELNHAREDLTKVRLSVRELYLQKDMLPTGSCSQVANLSEEEDDAYFSSYDHFSIHKDMLQDHIRTEAYRDFVYTNRDVFRDKVVLDAGCGTGILSMFAARAGAKKVIAVDQSEIVYKAMDIIRQNGFQEIVEVRKGKLEEIGSAVEKVDIIITEWMGYFLLFESMLDTILFVRDKYLAEDGLIFPNKCSVYLLAVDDQAGHKKHVSYWDNVYGFQMTCMKSEVVRGASVEVVRPETVVSAPCLLKEIEITKCDCKDLDYLSTFVLDIVRDGSITALVGYFDVVFDGVNMSKVMFSTGPLSDPTHWKQTVFLLEQPITVKQGEQISGELCCQKNRKAPRTLLIKVTLQNSSCVYILE